MLTNLTKKDLTWVLKAVSHNDTRPQLQYAHYLPDTKKLVATDSFRLHELSIDLGEEPLIFYKVPPSDDERKPFPDYHRWIKLKGEPQIVVIDKQKLKQEKEIEKQKKEETRINNRWKRSLHRTKYTHYVMTESFLGFNEARINLDYLLDALGSDTWDYYPTSCLSCQYFVSGHRLAMVMPVK